MPGVARERLLDLEHDDDLMSVIIKMMKTMVRPIMMIMMVTVMVIMLVKTMVMKS